MKKIMLIIPTLGGGGAERIVTELACSLNERQNEVIVISLYDKEYANSYYFSQLEEANIRVLFLGKRKGMDLFMVRKLRKIIKKYDPDCIHTHLYACIYAVFASLFIKKRFIHTVHSIVTWELPKVHRVIMGIAYKTRKVIPIAVSRIVYKEIRDYYHIDENRIRLVYNGINMSQFKKNIGLEKKYDFIYIGRVSGEKNPQMQVEAIEKVKKEYPNVKLCICGEGVLKKKLEEEVKVRKLEKNIVFMGHVGNVQEYLASSSFFVLTSNFEGFGLVLIESMAAGVPVIATKTDVINEFVIDGKEGYLVEKSNVGELAEIMKQCLSESGSDKYEEMSRNAQIRAEDFRLEKMVAGYEKLYEEI